MIVDLIVRCRKTQTATLDLILEITCLIIKANYFLNDNSNVNLRSNYIYLLKWNLLKLIAMNYWLTWFAECALVYKIELLENKITFVRTIN